MNPYEKRFKTALQANIDKRESYVEQQIEVHKVALKKAVDGITALQSSLSLLSDEVALQALRDANEKLNKDVDRIKRNISAAEESLKNAKIAFYQLQALCPHENKVYDHEDYHKNEEFFRCTLCGDIN